MNAPVREIEFRTLTRALLLLVFFFFFFLGKDAKIFFSNNETEISAKVCDLFHGTSTMRPIKQPNFKKAHIKPKPDLTA